MKINCMPPYPTQQRDEIFWPESSTNTVRAPRHASRTEKLAGIWLRPTALHCTLVKYEWGKEIIPTILLRYSVFIVSAFSGSFLIAMIIISNLC